MNSTRITNLPAPAHDLRGAVNPPNKPMEQPCRHPRVQIVSRDEDSEFVECLECREIFESSEFKDMTIEEGAQEEGEV